LGASTGRIKRIGISRQGINGGVRDHALGKKNGSRKVVLTLPLSTEGMASNWEEWGNLVETKKANWLAAQWAPVEATSSSGNAWVFSPPQGAYVRG